MSRPLRHILIARTDRIGDVVLSTPVAEALYEMIPGVKITFLAQPAVLPILRGVPSISNVMAYEPQEKHWGWFGVWNLAIEFAQLEADALILVAPDWKVAVAAWMARIPRRVGRLQRLTDFLFLNRSQRQRRSEVAKHEAEYNLDLVEWLLEKPVPSQIGTKIVVSASDRRSALAILERLRVKAPFWVVHPGMGGSALNWPPRSYASLIEGMLERGLRVVVSSGPQDQLQAFEVERWLSPEARKSDRLHWYRAHRELGSVGVLAGILEASAGVVAPSTGPLHMAVALGKRVVSVYPPVKVQSSKRWGPFRAKSAAVFSPNVTCPGKMGCLEDACELHPCMERLTGPQVLEQIAPNEGAGVEPNRTITTSP